MTRLPASVLSGILLAGLAGTLRSQETSKESGSASSGAASSKPSAHAESSLPDPGATRDGVYRNPAFGFSYKLPFGWVERTREMQDESDSAGAPKSLLLLAIFERPPEATGETVNSAVVIAAEPLSAYPGVKISVGYFAPLTELTTAQGFEAVGEPRAFPVGTTSVMRGDFTKLRGTLTMHQTSLVLLEKGYAISFTLIGGSADEVSQLIERLSFAPTKKPGPSHK